MKEVIGFKASACSSVQIPRHPGVILPLASTADASAKISPVLALAKVLKCANCQSLATPSFAEYIHSGESTILLGIVTPLIVIGLKSLVLFSIFISLF